MKITNTSEFFFEKNSSNKMKLFEFGMKKIEDDNINYFKSRPSKIPTQKFDKLHNHYGMIIQDGKIYLTKLPQSDLCENIWNQCLNLFKNTFTNND